MIEGKTAPILGRSAITCHLIWCSKVTTQFLWYSAQTHNSNLTRRRHETNPRWETYYKEMAWAWKMSRSWEMKEDWRTAPGQGKLESWQLKEILDQGRKIKIFILIYISGKIWMISTFRWYSLSVNLQCWCIWLCKKIYLNFRK